MLSVINFISDTPKFQIFLNPECRHNSNTSHFPDRTGGFNVIKKEYLRIIKNSFTNSGINVSLCNSFSASLFSASFCISSFLTISIIV